MNRVIKAKMEKQNKEITRLCKLKNDCRMLALSRMMPVKQILKTSKILMIIKEKN